MRSAERKKVRRKSSLFHLHLYKKSNFLKKRATNRKKRLKITSFFMYIAKNLDNYRGGETEVRLNFIRIIRLFINEMFGCIAVIMKLEI